MALRSFVLKVSAWNWVERFVRSSFLFRPVVRRFIGGDTLEDGLKNARPLLERGFLISLDLLGESVTTETEANASKDAYIEMLRAIEFHPNFKPYRSKQESSSEFESIENMNISIKLTQCGLDLADDVAERNLRDTLFEAKRLGTFVRVDMEASEYTERTISMLERVNSEFPNSGTVLQSYLIRTPVDLERLNRIRNRIRLVKGAYLESSTVAFSDKADVDSAYFDLAKTMLRETNYPAFATHDEQLVDRILSCADEAGIDKSRYEFQMLYGIRRDLQDRLLESGYRVRIYIPFGNSWYPYFSRRLAERPANFWFIVRALFKR